MEAKFARCIDAIHIDFDSAIPPAIDGGSDIDPPLTCERGNLALLVYGLNC
jgi:hypothetical protein